MSTPSDAEVEQLGQRIDAIPDLSGAGIGFVGDDACTVLRVSAHASGLNTYVILQEEDVPPPPAEPDIKSELIGIGFNCGGAGLAWSAMAGQVRWLARLAPEDEGDPAFEIFDHLGDFKGTVAGQRPSP